MKDITTDIRIIAVGKKGQDLFVRRGYKVSASFTNLPDPPKSTDLLPVAKVAVDDYLAGEVDQVYIAFTDFVNMVTRYPRIKQLLPLKPVDYTSTSIAEFFEAPDVSAGDSQDYTYEPQAEELLNAIVPRFADLQLYQSFLESVASEHSARYVAMNNATENAKALVEDLTIARNKARQTAITAEILDIVGGAEAVAD